MLLFILLLILSYYSTSIGYMIGAFVYKKGSLERCKTSGGKNWLVYAIISAPALLAKRIKEALSTFTITKKGE